jgi:GNAT superfamily N-acetyltransferase
VFDRETSAEIDGLRRALGEPDLGKIPPHLTLVPPVNVRDVDEAERVVRAAANTARPLALVLGPLATFLPDNPVAYLTIDGDVAAVHGLRDGVFRPPLERELSWPYVPHVTVADGIDPARIAAAVPVMAEYRRAVTADRVALLEEVGRVWKPIATFPLGPPSVIGRGGQPLELDVLGDATDATITAWRDGNRVGAVEAWRRGEHAWLRSLDVVETFRRQGVATHLLAAAQSWAAAQGAVAIEVDPEMALDTDALEFLAARGWQHGASRPRRTL